MILLLCVLGFGLFGLKFVEGCLYVRLYCVVW